MEKERKKEKEKEKKKKRKIPEWGADRVKGRRKINK